MTGSEGMGWTFMGHFLERYGYGNAVIEIWRAMGKMAPPQSPPEARGEARVRRLDMVEQSGYDEEKGELRFPCLDAQAWHWEVPGRAVVMTIPSWWPFVECDELIGFTMCESTRVPRDFVGPILERADRVIVPCEHCREVYEALPPRPHPPTPSPVRPKAGAQERGGKRGRRVPVSVVPLGVDGEGYQVVDRGGRDGPYRFLWSGTPDVRKGFDVAYRAFWAAFEGSRDVELVMHFRALPTGLNGCRDGNVRLVEGLVPQEVWLGLLGEADCFLYPARGEGWGLPPREAACTGLPVICTDWGGLREGLANWGLPVGVKGMVAATFGPWEAGEIGEWAEPDFDEVVFWMRWCAENRERARELGGAAASWIRGNQTWEHSARALLGVME